MNKPPVEVGRLYSPQGRRLIRDVHYSLQGSHGFYEPANAEERGARLVLERGSGVRIAINVQLYTDTPEGAGCAWFSVDKSA